MNWDPAAGNWKQLKGKIKEQWGKLTDDEVDKIAGKRDQLVGRAHEKYGIKKDDAEKQVKDWETRNPMKSSVSIGKGAVTRTFCPRRGGCFTSWVSLY